MTRGNQRDADRERAKKRLDKGKISTDYLKKKDTDAEIMRIKQKMAEEKKTKPEDGGMNSKGGLKAKADGKKKKGKDGDDDNQKNIPAYLKQFAHLDIDEDDEEEEEGEEEKEEVKEEED